MCSAVSGSEKKYLKLRMAFYSNCIWKLKDKQKNKANAKAQ